MSATLVFSGCEMPMIFGAALDFQKVAQNLVYIGLIILVTVVVTLWLASGRVTLRDSRGRSDERRRRSTSRWFGRSKEQDDSDGKRRRRRRRRRNPTLAEIGGLPPIRSESNPDPPKPPGP